jgi:hypothetical protein
MNLGYYPGCALHGSSNDYEQSLRACLGALDVTLAEIDDWICCGATSAHSLNHQLAIALPARNLALARRQGLAELFAPCPMCSMQLLRAGQAMQSDPRLRQEISGLVEAEVHDGPCVLNLIQVFQRIGLDRLKAALVLYARLASPEDLLLDGWVRPANSIKELLLPRHEVLYGYRVDLGPYRPYEAQSLPGRLAAGHRDSPCRTCTSLTSWK